MKMQMKAALAALLTIFVLSNGAVAQDKPDGAAAQDKPEHLTLITDTVDTLNQYFKHAEWEGVKNMMGAAKAIVVMPDFTSGALIVGYERGSGVMMTRHGETWSDPAFVALSQRTIGFQAGVKRSQLIMLVLTRSAVKDLIAGVERVGGSGGFALGPLGVGASGAGGISGGLQILTVTVSEGLSLGGGLADSSISALGELNSATYGEKSKLTDILGKQGGGVAEAKALRDLLTEAVRASWRD